MESPSTFLDETRLRYVEMIDVLDYSDADVFTQTLKIALTQLELNSRELAKAAGIAPSTLYRWAKGENNKHSLHMRKGVMQAIRQYMVVQIIAS